MKHRCAIVITCLALGVTLGCAPAGGPQTAGAAGMDRGRQAVTTFAACGPQSPRDIGRAGGTNGLPVPGDGSRPPRLCAMHFHRPAEHAGIGACPAVSTGATTGVCAGQGEEPVTAGDAIEAHWVYTSCPAPPQRLPGLANCTCEGDEMVLMVVAQKYVLSAEAGAAVDSSLREPTGGLLRYAGSTTGPTYSGGDPDDPRPCSPARVQWAVAHECRALELSALGAWCAANEWGEDHAHGVREVIRRADWLSPHPAGGS